ncbi:hypothetical protein [Actinomadura sp. 9N407]|uniref:hypothetical protein n=1 Tax=Actinomadura sp. 9N407 TaxID=3375154 RepID=UPI0037BDD7A0
MSGAMGESKFNADNIERFGGKLIVNVGGYLKQARLDINDAPRRVEASSFTTFCPNLAHAYIQATEYADVDLITKERVLLDVDEKLKTTAKILREAEKKSTVRGA